MSSAMTEPSDFRYPTPEDLLSMRTSAGLNQDRVAADLGMDKTTVRRLESEDYNHNVGLAAKLLSYYQYMNEMEAFPMEPDPFEFEIASGEELMEMREAAGVSRIEMAEAIGIHENNIMPIEVRDGRFPRRDTYFRMLEVLSESLEDRDAEE